MGGDVPENDGRTILYESDLRQNMAQGTDKFWKITGNGLERPSYILGVFHNGVPKDEVLNTPNLQEVLREVEVLAPETLVGGSENAEESFKPFKDTLKYMPRFDENAKLQEYTAKAEGYGTVTNETVDDVFGPNSEELAHLKKELPSRYQDTDISNVPLVDIEKDLTKNSWEMMIKNVQAGLAKTPLSMTSTEETIHEQWERTHEQLDPSQTDEVAMEPYGDDPNYNGRWGYPFSLDHAGRFKSPDGTPIGMWAYENIAHYLHHKKAANQMLLVDGHFVYDTKDKKGQRVRREDDKAACALADKLWPDHKKVLEKRDGISLEKWQDLSQFRLNADKGKELWSDSKLQHDVSWVPDQYDPVNFWRSPPLEFVQNVSKGDRYSRMMSVRNLQQCSSIKKLITEGSTVLAEPGILHLFGHYGVVAILRTMGYTVEPVK